ncbi:hypothetical protein QUF64_07865 [Anaerolineales bacterium HSG6]|nr:hypothetical protein [Anaerolineales bacterium HSG6]MDM8532890.1 hypothetical protein [Anaerolineales bacterium HSG25]
MSQQVNDRGTGPAGVGRNDGSSSLKLWLKADVDVELNGDSVLKWQDQSGCGNDALQMTATAQPTFTARNPIFNGLPTVQFNGWSHFLRVKHTPTLNMVQAITGFLVIRTTNVNKAGLMTIPYSDDILFSLKKSQTEFEAEARLCKKTPRKHNVSEVSYPLYT